MRKNFIIQVAALITFAVFTSNISAQSVFAKGDKIVSLGVGLGDYLGGTGYKTSVMPISLSGEYCFTDNLFDEKSSLGVGAYVAYAANKYENTIASISYGYKYSYAIVGARGAFHYQFVDKLDTYAGLMLGYNLVYDSPIGTLHHGESNAKASSFGYSTFVGARYYFTDNVAVFGEVGYGIALLELGLTVKF